jgi:chromosome segregation ATPase
LFQFSNDETLNNFNVSKIYTLLKFFQSFYWLGAELLQENLPEEIIVTLKGLWERVMDQAEEKVNAVQQRFEQRLAELEETAEKLQSDNSCWQQRYRQLQQEKEGLSSDKSALQQIVRQLEDEKLALTTAQEHLLQQLQERQERLEASNQFNQQIEANLAHYREASREQRLLDQQRYEQAQLQLEQTLTHLQHQVMALTQEKNALQNHYERVSHEKDRLQSQYDQLAHEHELIKSQWAETDAKMTQYAHTTQSFQSQCQKMQITIDEQSLAIINLQKQLAVTLDHLSSAKEELTTLNERYQSQAHEKWLLAQEKAQLEGQFMLMREMMPKPMDAIPPSSLK